MAARLSSRRQPAIARLKPRANTVLGDREGRGAYRFGVVQVFGPAVTVNQLCGVSICL
jgi:hypothetical protein